MGAGGAGAWWLSRSGGDAPDTVQDIQKEADNLRNKASDHRDAGRYEQAIEAYKSAVQTYGEAKAQATEEDQIAIFKGELVETREQLEKTEERLAQLNAVREPLTDAENSFQTAIAQHIQKENIPASRDYRQAKNHYKQALTALDESDFDIFGEEESLTVSGTIEASYPPEKLVAWQRLTDDELDALSDAGIGSLTELQDAGESVIADLLEQDAIDEELANRLRAALWWHGDEERTFTSRQTIERQRNRAEKGRQMLQ